VQTNMKRKLAIGTTALAAAAFAGGAYAANQDSGLSSRQAFLNDLAKRLNVTPKQLSGAVQGAFIDQLQAAVAAGKLTQAQADAIKQRVQQGDAPPLGALGWFGPLGGGAWLGPDGGGGGPNFRGPDATPGEARLEGRLAAAAKYLGISDTQLFDQLTQGKSLAQIAQSRGKPVAGLKAAMIAAIRSKLDELVAAKEMTSADALRVLSKLSAGLDGEINGTGFGLHRMFRGRAQFGVAPTPPGSVNPTAPMAAAPVGPGLGD
jgi:hypothetical protein